MFGRILSEAVAKLAKCMMAWKKLQLFEILDSKSILGVLKNFKISGDTIFVHEVALM